MSDQHIKECKRQWFEDGDLQMNYFDWLINQAERVEKLEEELNGVKGKYGYKQMYGKCNRDYANLHYEKERYKQALILIKNRHEDTQDGTFDIASEALKGGR